MVLRGRLEPEVGALLLKAIAAARETLYPRTRIGGEVQSGTRLGTRQNPGIGQVD